MNNTDDWTGAAKPTEMMDPPSPESKSTFGSYKTVDGKCCVDSDITRQASAISGGSVNPAGIDITIPGGLDKAPMKTPMMSPQAADPASAGGLVTDDVK